MPTLHELSRVTSGTYTLISTDAGNTSKCTLKQTTADTDKIQTQM